MHDEIKKDTLNCEQSSADMDYDHRMDTRTV